MSKTVKFDRDLIMNIWGENIDFNSLVYSIYEKLSIIDETIKKVKLDWHKKIWILWTINSIKNSLYWKKLEEKKLAYCVIKEQKLLEDINAVIIKMIWWIESLEDKDIEALKKSVEYLKSKKCTAIILWCTELPIAFWILDINFDIPLYDPITITSEVACKIYYK